MHAFSGNGTCGMALAVPPVRVDTATDAGGGVVHVAVREVTMLRGVELEMRGRGTATLGEPGKQECDAGMSQQRTGRAQSVTWFRSGGETPNMLGAFFDVS